MAWEDLFKKVKKSLQDVLDNTTIDENIGGLVKNPVKYFTDPTYNKGENFWSTSVAKVPAFAQETIQKAEDIPRIKLNIPQVRTGSKGLDLAVNAIPNFAAGVAEDAINIPGNYIKGIARTGDYLGEIARGDAKFDTGRMVRSVAPTAEAIFDVASLGTGKGVAKDLTKDLGKKTFTKIVLKGAGEGAKFGGASSFLRASSDQGKDNFNWDQIFQDTLSGTVGGGMLGGLIGGAGFGIGEVKKALADNLMKKNPRLTTDEALKVVDQIPRDKFGRFTQKIEQKIKYPGLNESEYNEIKAFEKRKFIQDQNGNLKGVGGQPSVNFEQNKKLIQIKPKDEMGTVYINPNPLNKISDQDLNRYNFLIEKNKKTLQQRESGKIDLEAEVNIGKNSPTKKEASEINKITTEPLLLKQNPPQPSIPQNKLKLTPDGKIRLIKKTDTPILSSLPEVKLNGQGNLYIKNGEEIIGGIPKGIQDKLYEISQGKELDPSKMVFVEKYLNLKNLGLVRNNDIGIYEIKPLTQSNPFAPKPRNQTEIKPFDYDKNELKPLSKNTKVNVKTIFGDNRIPTSERGVGAAEQKRTGDNLLLSSQEVMDRINKIDVKKKANIIDLFRTPEHVLKKFGMENELGLLRTAQENYTKELKNEINRVSAWEKRVPGPVSSQRIFDYLDGQNIKLDQGEFAVASEIKDYLSKWADRLGIPKEGRITNYITHIFEKGDVELEFNPDIAKMIEGKVSGSVYDPFLKKREGGEDYVRDAWRALDAYVKRATRKVNFDPALDRIQMAAEKLDLDSYKYIQKYISGINMRPTEVDNLVDNSIKSIFGYKFGARPTAYLTGKARQVMSRAMLGLNPGSALRNLSQGANTYATLGEKYTLKGYYSLAKNMATNNLGELYENGILEEGMVQDRSLHAVKSLAEKADPILYSMFEWAEKVNRGSAYFGAKAKGMANGMLENQAIEYAKSVVRRTQFSFNKVDTPISLQSDIMKTAFQFGTYSLKQAEFLGGMVKNKDFAGLLRYTGSSLLFMATLGSLIGMRPSELIPSISFTPPAIKLASNVVDTASAFKDGKNGKGVENSMKSGAMFIPGGSQIKKTYEGLKAVNQGFSETPNGSVRFPVEQSVPNAIKGGLFGQWNLPEGKKYFKDGNKPLSQKQSEKIKGSSDKKSEYDEIIEGRENNSKVQEIKDQVLSDGKEQTFNGKKYYLSKEFDSKTGESKPIVKSVKIFQSASDIYENLPKEYETSKDSPKNILSKIAVYGTGIFKDPQGTINAIKTGQPIRKINGDVVVLERMMGLSALDIGNTETEVDHIIPISLGGDNSESNLMIISKEDNRAKGIVETYLAKELKAGRITKKEAQERDLNWRNEINNLPSAKKLEAQKKLKETPLPTKTKETNGKILDTLSSREYKPIKTVDEKGVASYSNIKIKIPEYPTLTGKTELDKELKSKYKSALSTTKTNIGKLYLDGQISAQEANDAILSLKSKSSSVGSGSKKLTINFTKLKEQKFSAVTPTSSPFSFNHSNRSKIYLKPTATKPILKIKFKKLEAPKIKFLSNQI